MTMQIFPTWRDENASGPYPFTDSSTLVDLTGNVNVPASAFVDASFWVPDPSLPLFLLSIEVRPRSIVVTVANNLSRPIASGVWPPPTGFDRSLIPLTDNQDNQVGLLVGKEAGLSSLLKLAQGTYFFSPSIASFVISTCLIFGDDAAQRNVSGELLPEQGDVYIVGERGIQLETRPGSEVIKGEIVDITKVYVHAVGDPLSARAVCEANQRFVEKRFITEVVFQKGQQTHRCAPINGEVYIVTTSPQGTESSLRIINQSVNPPKKPSNEIFPLYTTTGPDDIPPRSGSIAFGLFGKQLRSIR
jgi:hypothetical protein